MVQNNDAQKKPLSPLPPKAGLELPQANRRTSQIIDPLNGRLPSRTAAGQHRAETIGSPPDSRIANGPEDRERAECCIMGRSVPFLGLFFDQRV